MYNTRLWLPRNKTVGCLNKLPLVSTLMCLHWTTMRGQAYHNSATAEQQNLRVEAASPESQQRPQTCWDWSSPGTIPHLPAFSCGVRLALYRMSLCLCRVMKSFCSRWSENLSTLSQLATASFTSDAYSSIVLNSCVDSMTAVANSYLHKNLWRRAEITF